MRSSAAFTTGLETHSLGWPPERQAKHANRGPHKTWQSTHKSENKEVYRVGALRVLHEQIRANRPPRPLLCAARGETDWDGEKRSAPDQASEWCTNKANDIISSSDLFDPARLSLLRPSRPVPCFVHPPLPPSALWPPLSRRLSASPLLFPTPCPSECTTCCVP